MIKNTFLIALAVASTFGLSLPTNADADCSGVYLGIQGGYAHTNYDLGSFFDEHFSDDNIAGRAYVGVQFNENFGLETGFTMITGTELPDDFGDVRTTHWDLLLKAGLPFGDSGFRGDLKGGGVHVMTKFDANHVAESAGLDDVKHWKIKPIAGASLSYAFNCNIAVDVSYFHIFGDQSHSSFHTPTTDLAVVGISYCFPVFSSY